MNARERAEEVHIRLQRNSVRARQIGIIERAIIAAEEAKAKEERQACMEIMRDEVGEAAFNDPFSREGELARRAVNKIKARSEGEKKEE